MLNRPRPLTGGLVAVVMSVNAFCSAHPAAGDPPRVKYCGDSIDGAACHGTEDSSPGGKNSTAPAYTGPTRLELAYERCEEGDYVAGPVPCKAGASAADMLRRMLADRPGSPGTAAREVVALLGLRPPRIGIVPRPGPNSMGLVGLNNWMWVDNPDAQTFGPATATGNIDAWTVTLTGHVESVDWDMGDGQVIHCTGAGTPYQDGYGFDPSPDCGHVYTRQGVYTVGATAHWRVDWTTSDGAQSGTFTVDQTATDEITIGEWQVLVQSGRQ